MLVITQPGEHRLVVLQVREADFGFKGDKIDELALLDIGLQVRDVLFNVGDRGDVVDVFDGRKQRIVGLEAGVGIQKLAGLKKHGKDWSWVDFVIGGKRDGHFQLLLVRRHFRTAEHEVFTMVGGSTCKSSAACWFGSLGADNASRRRKCRRHGARGR